MTLEQLRIFVAVAERQHVTRAAAELHLTQSAVPSAISALEPRHDVRLFDRVGRSIVLNPVGEAFLAEARAVLAQAQAAERALADFGGLRRGRLAVAASQTVASYWLPPRLAAFFLAADLCKSVLELVVDLRLTPTYLLTPDPGLSHEH